MKVVFLDVDGVLNTANTFERVYHSFKNSGKKELEIDLFRLQYLKQIIDETDSKIVLSSTWRRFFQKLDDKIIPRNEKGKLFYEVLNNYGIEIYDILSYQSDINREGLILDWLSKNEVDSFVIIDDEPNLFYTLLDRLIKTSKVKDNCVLANMNDCFGLSEQHIEVAKEMLRIKVKVKK